MYIRAYSSTWPSRLTREREREGVTTVCVCVNVEDTFLEGVVAACLVPKL